MNKAQRLLSSSSRLAIALAVLSAGISLRCGSEETAPDPSGDGVSGSAGQPSIDEPGGAPGGGSVCEPFATRRCVGPAACVGGQACSKDGSAWSACDCGTGPRGSAGAGSANGGAEGGGGSGGSIPNPVACEPAPQSGCDTDEKCTLAVVTATQSVSFQCVPDGTKPEGAECALREDGTDDCAQGLFCNGVSTVPRCQPYCDVTDAVSCDTLCTELNVGHGGVAVASGYGVCQPPCDLLAQDCDEGDACVFLESPFPVCGKAGAAAPGETCVYYDDCEAGAACVLKNAAQTASMCTPFCEATQAGSCEAEGDTCLAFPMLYDPVPQSFFTMGLCYPCVLLGIPDCALLAPGGCAEEADCEPLLVSMGLPFTCDPRAGACVMAAP